MRLPRRQFVQLAAAAVAAHAAPRIASAQSYPEKPVRMIVPYAPGGPTDVITRLVAQRLTDHVGKQFFVENVGGGGGNIGMGRAAKAAPDGYTALVVNPSYVINPTLYDKVPYEFGKDFDPVTLMVLTTLVLAVHPSVPARTVSELVALIRANPGKYSYASPASSSVARPRPRARAVQQRGPGGRLVGCRAYADLLRLAIAGGATGDRRQAARACGHEQGALAVAARCAHHGGGRLPRHRRRQLAGRHGARRDAARGHRLPPSRDRRHLGDGGCQGAPGGARLRAGREHAGGIRQPDQARARCLGQGDPGVRHQGAVKLAGGRERGEAALEIAD